MTNQSYAQNNSFSCGFVPTADERAHYQAVMAQLQSSPQQMLTDIPLNASIPIYFWVNKESPESAPTALELQAAVDRVNTYFHFPNNARFTFCGVSYLRDDRWFHYNNDNPFRHQVYALYHSDNAINVYLPQTLHNDFAALRGEAKVLLKGLNEHTFAHELGHTFGLLHTFNDPGTLSELVIREVDGNKPNPTPNWGTAADGMKSTPADPAHCSGLCFTCSGVDANQDAYAPLYNNLMANHCWTNSSIFNQEQQNKMNTALMDINHRGTLGRPSQASQSAYQVQESLSTPHRTPNVHA